MTGFSAGTGSAFSLLPPQNATGNWIKIVQRVPVRIEIDPADLREHPLLVGLSAVVKVDTSDTSGRLLAASARTEPVPGDLVSQAPPSISPPSRRPSPASSGTTPCPASA
ncbi:MAG: HlyD family secretion protein, partial [Bilophila wadsworthia]